VNQPASQSHVLDQAVALKAESDDLYTGQTHPAYQNMVGPFGGVIGSTLLNAILTHPQLLGEPVSLTIHYAAPIADGGFSIRTRAMRTNRSTQHWLIELLQDDQVVTFATAVTAKRRDTWSTTDAPFPQVPAAETLEPTHALSQIPWTSCYEMRFVDGVFDDLDSREHPSQTRVWIRDQPARPLDFLSLAGLCDAFFPRVFIRRNSRVPIGTVALTTYFHADAEQLAAQGSDPILGVARGLHFGKGFFDQSAEMWSAQGELLATSHQVVYFKE